MYEATSVPTATSMGFVVFGLMAVTMGVSARKEIDSAFNTDIFNESKQLMLYGFALLITLLATELAFLQRMLGTTSLSGDQWLICVGFAIALLLVDEVVKFFLRRSRSQPTDAAPAAKPAAVAPQAPA